MTDCPHCEYHKNRAAMWRAEAYAQAGHDIIERPPPSLGAPYHGSGGAMNVWRRSNLNIDIFRHPTPMVVL